MIKYRHLFFDLDNTIWDFNLNSWYALRETFIQYRLDLSFFERFYEIYVFHNERLWELYRQNGITKEELSRSRFELSFAETGISGVNATDFNRDYLERMPLQTRLCDGARHVLAKLSEKYDMHIITNGFAEVQYKKLGNSDLSGFFKKVFVSEEIKSPKPSPEIFRHAMKSCNARKKESLMIGDSWEVDIVGAMQTGMDQVFYDPSGENEREGNTDFVMKRDSGTVTFIIRRLDELLIIL